MKIIIIDGQGGRIGAALTRQFVEAFPDAELIAIGTNSTATGAMLKAGVALAATGENPVVVNAEDADLILGPIGILSANALLGEITPRMAAAISQSRAKKILIPVSKCSVMVAGVRDLPLSDYIREALTTAKAML